MREKSQYVLGWGALILAVMLGFVTACYNPRLFFGLGGKYNQAMIELGRGRGGNIDLAIVNLEEVARKDPTYRDSLTQLGRAYYRRGRYQDAYLILQRALAINKEDEIAWLVLGIAQLRLGQDEAGLEVLKGGLTLMNKVNGEGYRGYDKWDRAGKVRNSVRRAVLAVLKGLEEKDNVIRSVEVVLAQVDNEDFALRIGQYQDYKEEFEE